MIICRRASSSPSKSEPLNQAVSGIPGRRDYVPDVFDIVIYNTF